MKISALYLCSLLALCLTACGQKAPKPSPTATAGQPGSSAVQQALPWASDRDPVCDMKIDQTEADTVHYAGKIYGFCSNSCKTDFLGSPSKYAGQ